MIDREEAWNAALNLYQKSGVESHVIMLQDRFHCNVNLVLLLAYIDSLPLALTPQAISDLQHAIADSENELHAFRQYRKDAKTGDPNTYKAIKQQEIEMERDQHQILIAVANRTVKQTSATRTYSLLTTYLQSMRVGDTVIRDTQTLLSATFIH